MSFRSFLRGMLPVAGPVVGNMLLPGLGGVLGGLAGTAGAAAIGRSRGERAASQDMYPSRGIARGERATQLPTMTPEQQEIANRNARRGMEALENLPQAEFGPIEESALSQFRQGVVPGISETFTGAGAGGQRSSAFEQALGGAEAGLREKLAAMKQLFNMQRRGQEQSYGMNLLNMGMQPQFGYHVSRPEVGGGDFMGGRGQSLTSTAPIFLMDLLRRYLQPQNQQAEGRYALRQKEYSPSLTPSYRTR